MSQGYETYCGLLRMYDGFSATPDPAVPEFEYHHSHRGLTELRTRYRLDRVAGDGAPLLRSLRLNEWLHRHVRGRAAAACRLPFAVTDMATYISRRLLLMVPTLILISLIAYGVIELPPGDFVTTRIGQLIEQGEYSEEALQNLRHRYGLDRPLYFRYFKWLSRFLRGDLGYSLSWNKPVQELLLSRFVLTALVSLLSLLFTWVVAFPIGIYSAINKYSVSDFLWTIVGFIGLAIPNFLFALILMYLSYKYLPTVGIGGLFSERYLTAPWSFAKFVDLLAHLWIPVLVIGTAGTAGLIRIVRANLIDELKKPYVSMARSRGLSEARVILKYPVRIAINPFLSTVGWVLPSLIAGETITSVVLGLPTAGPLFLEALRRQDMQLAGAFVMLSAVLTVVGTLFSDILLAIVDPRIRYR